MDEMQRIGDVAIGSTYRADGEQDRFFIKLTPETHTRVVLNRAGKRSFSTKHEEYFDPDEMVQVLTEPGWEPRGGWGQWDGGVFTNVLELHCIGDISLGSAYVRPDGWTFYKVTETTHAKVTKISGRWVLLKENSGEQFDPNERVEVLILCDLPPAEHEE